MLAVVVGLFVAIKILASLAQLLEKLVQQNSLILNETSRMAFDLREVENHTRNAVTAAIYPQSAFMQQRRIEEVVENECYY
jgi:hypothetical protein